MPGKRNKKGFTLVEMLVVIAIIAILAVMITPYARSVLKRAKATNDAAFLRSVWSKATVALLDSDVEKARKFVDGLSVQCASFPNARLYLLYKDSEVLAIYFANFEESSTHYYPLEYFMDLASGMEESDQFTVQPIVPPRAQWLIAGQSGGQ